MSLSRRLLVASVLVALVAPVFVGCAPGESDAKVVNVYTARHYDSDDAVYAAFTEATGIEVNLLEDRADALLERIKTEGAASPADVFITVDAGRLYQAEQLEVFGAIGDAALDERIPSHLRHPDGLWVGFTKRARVIAYAKDRVDPAAVSRYEDLADPKWRGKLLVRSSSSVYNQSLVGSIIDAAGEEAAEAWCAGIVANLARPPQGGDRDQIRALAAGEGDVAIVNSYYHAMMLQGSDEDRAVAEQVGLIFPNQEGRGAHVNISGAGIVKSAPNRDNALEFLRYLTGEAAQELLAAASNEYPTVPGVPLNATLESFGPFKEDAVNASVFGNNNPVAIQMMDRVGWR